MTLLIKNVKIIGGESKFPKPVDVFVNDDKISAIGNLSNKKADEVVDGGGAYLSPGFIDVNTDSDHYLSLFEYPEQIDF
ncbi:MAG: D-aminoacylase, partial [Candidatus Liptonbacteria bacterium]|nr:D-aminoacylase [Candidatus Liptonbacteria bacterium]